MDPMTLTVAAVGGFLVWRASKSKKSAAHDSLASSARPQIESEMVDEEGNPVELTDNSGTGAITKADDFVGGAKEQPMAPSGPTRLNFSRGSMASSVESATIAEATEKAPTLMVH